MVSPSAACLKNMEKKYCIFYSPQIYHNLEMSRTILHCIWPYYAVLLHLSHDQMEYDWFHNFTFSIWIFLSKVTLDF